MAATTRKVRPERTGWRDQALSEWHRSLGWHLPALDLDFVLVEYSSGWARALIEYKSVHAALVRPDHPSIKALVRLADAARIPAFLVRYASDLIWFQAEPLNGYARRLLPETTTLLASDYKRLLERLRDRVPAGGMATVCSSSGSGGGPVAYPPRHPRPGPWRRPQKESMGGAVS